MTVVRPIGAFLVHGWRHAMVGMAILAVLAMALRIHPHADDAGGLGHAGSVVLQAILGDLPGDPLAPSLPDEACDCASVPALAAEAGLRLPAPLAIAGVRMSHPDDLPDSLSYPPDPPPARLG